MLDILRSGGGGGGANLKNVWILGSELGGLNCMNLK